MKLALDLSGTEASSAVVDDALSVAFRGAMAVLLFGSSRCCCPLLLIFSTPMLLLWMAGVAASDAILPESEPTFSTIKRPFLILFCGSRAVAAVGVTVSMTTFTGCSDADDKSITFVDIISNWLPSLLVLVIGK